MRFVPVGPDLLRAFDQDAVAWMRSLSSGEPQRLEVLHDRDMVFHRKIMALIGELAKALHTTPDLVRAQLLMATGHYQHLGELSGKTVISVNSMSRRAMTDRELHLFWDNAREVIEKEWLPEIRDAATREHLASQLSLQAA
jgi:hypothetical protein